MMVSNLINNSLIFYIKVRKYLALLDSKTLAKIYHTSYLQRIVTFMY